MSTGPTEPKPQPPTRLAREPHPAPRSSTPATEPISPRNVDDLPLVLTLAQAAKLLSVDRRTLYPHIRRGDLRAFKVGNAYRIERDALLSFIRADRPHSTRR